MVDMNALGRNVLKRLDEKPKPANPDWIAAEREKCTADPFYFIDTYCQIYDNATAQWIPFTLWPGQRRALQQVIDNKYTIVLKARQEGLSWLLGDAYPLWQMLFKPIAEVLIFSQRDDEAIKLLDRLHGTYDRLPDWMKPGVTTDAAHELRMVNGSGAQALPATTGGRSNAATYVFVDEADFVDKVDSLVNFAMPTVDIGANKLIMNSTVNKNAPGSYFQRMYRAARDDGLENWGHIFLAWFEHPERTREWYDKRCRDAMRLEGTLDSIFEQYPETDEQALQGRTLDKRIPPHWMVLIYQERLPIVNVPPEAPVIPGLKYYLLPEPGRKYGLGADPAEGNPRSDDSTVHVIDADTKQQCAVLAGKIEPDTLARHAVDLANYYNAAPIMPERNNHGHQMIAELQKRGATIRAGEDGKPGWLNLRRTDKPTQAIVGSKVKLYDTIIAILSEHIANAEEAHEKPYPLIFNFETSSQLSSLDAKTLSAPENQHDDYAVGWALAQMCVYHGTPSMEIVRHNLWGEQAQAAARDTAYRAPIAQAGRSFPQQDAVARDKAMELLRLRGIKTRR